MANNQLLICGAGAPPFPAAGSGWKWRHSETAFSNAVLVFARDGK
jgi:hypothetical protein